MSVAGIIFSLSFTHFNAAPRHDDYYAWNASGNQISCSIQGFMTSVEVSSGFVYGCALNLYSLVVVRYHKTDGYVRKNLEPYLHGVPIAYAFITGIILLVKNIFNDTGGGNCCAPEYRPPHCVGYEDGQILEGFDIPCGRGSDGVVLLYYLAVIITITVVPIVICISLGMIYRSVLQQEKRMERCGSIHFSAGNHQPSGDSDEISNHESWTGRIRSMFRIFDRSPGRASASNQNQRRSNRRAVMRRALYFSTPYFLTWPWFIISNCFAIAGIECPAFRWCLFSIFNPLHGFFNFCIFMYSKVKDAKVRGDESMTWSQAFEKAFRSREIDRTATRRGGQPPNRTQQARAARIHAVTVERYGRPEAGATHQSSQADPANVGHGTTGEGGSEAATTASVENGLYYSSLRGMLSDSDQHSMGNLKQASIESVDIERALRGFEEEKTEIQSH